MDEAQRLTEPMTHPRELAGRLKRLRIHLFGEGGVPEIAARLGLPRMTWSNYEAGVVVPATVVLLLIELTGVEPAWLLSGQGEMLR